MIIILPSDSRIGTLTPEGEYKWPSVNSAGNGYPIPNDNIHWLDTLEDGSRRFVVLAPDMLDETFVISEPITATVTGGSETIGYYATDIVYPDLTEEETKPAETVEDEPPADKHKSKAKSKK